MIEERIKKSKSAVEEAETLSADQKAELLGLLSKAQSILGKVSKTHKADAYEIARLVETSLNEASRAQKNPGKIQSLLQDLKQSIEKFETSHPDLVHFVTEYSTLLAAMGI
jgi:hypothetical protein